MPPFDLFAHLVDCCCSFGPDHLQLRNPLLPRRPPWHSCGVGAAADDLFTLRVNPHVEAIAAATAVAGVDV